MVDDNYEPNLIRVRVMNFKKICMTGAACLAIGILPMPSVASASSNNSDNSDEQSTYAYKHMYLKTNPSYFFPSSMYVKSPSYCSKYVYLAYEWGATKRALYPIPGPSAVVLPHGLENWFKGDFTPSYVYKVTSY